MFWWPLTSILSTSLKILSFMCHRKQRVIQNWNNITIAFKVFIASLSLWNREKLKSFSEYQPSFHMEEVLRTPFMCFQCLFGAEKEKSCLRMKYSIQGLETGLEQCGRIMTELSCLGFIDGHSNSVSAEKLETDEKSMRCRRFLLFTLPVSS